MRGEKRGQAAIEFLSAYGWALIIIGVAIAAFFFYFGFDKSYVVNDSCELTPGFSCNDFYVDDSSIVLNVRNNMDWDISSIQFSYEGCQIKSAKPSLKNGEKKIFVMNECNFTSAKLFEEDNLFVEYTFEGNSITHNKQFSLTASIEDGESQSFGGTSYIPDGATVLLMDFNDGDGEIASDATAYNNFGMLKNFDTAVGLWRFNEGGGLVISDDSPNGFNGFIGNNSCNSGQGPCPIWTAFGVSGPALQFDGTNDRAEVPHNALLNPTTDFTISSWIKWMNHPTSGKKEAVISKGRTIFAYKMMVKDVGPAQLEGQVNTKEAVAPYAQYEKKWEHVALVYDSFSRKLYVGGILAATSVEAPLGPASSNAYNVWFGDSNFPADPQYQFNGTIDEVALYNVTLMPDEIAWQHISQKAILYRGWSKGKNDAGMQFDGKDDYIDLGDDSDLEFSDSNFTIEAWIKLDKLPTVSNKDNVIFSKYASGQYEYAIYVNKNSNKLSFFVSPQGSTVQAVSSASALATGVWYHVAAVKEDSKARVYINGKLDGSAINFPQNIFTGNAHAIVGNIEGSGKEFNGIIDDLRVSNYARY